MPELGSFRRRSGSAVCCIDAGRVVIDGKWTMVAIA